MTENAAELTGVELEARLITQEHRTVRVWMNFIMRKQWKKDDPRRAACIHALVWWCFSPGTIALTSGGTIGVLTVILLLWQDILIERQNAYFQQQIGQTQEQLGATKEQLAQTQDQFEQIKEQADQQRRTDLMDILYETVADDSGKGKPKYNARTRSEALLEFVKLERDRGKEIVDLSGARLDGIRLAPATSQQLVDLQRVDFRGAIMTRANLHRVDFQDTVLEDARVDHAVVSDCSFIGATCDFASFQGTHLAYRNSFGRADLHHADFRGAQFFIQLIKPPGLDPPVGRDPLRDILMFVYQEYQGPGPSDIPVSQPLKWRYAVYDPDVCEALAIDCTGPDSDSFPCCNPSLVTHLDRQRVQRNAER